MDPARLPAFEAFANGTGGGVREPLAYFRAYGLPIFHGFRERVVIAGG